MRYSVLCLGIVYGFSHQRSITAAQKAASAQHEYEHKQKLIDQAKEAYAKSKQTTTAAGATSGGGRELFLPLQRGIRRERPNKTDLLETTVNQDPMDSKFDLEAYFKALMEQKP